MTKFCFGVRNVRRKNLSESLIFEVFRVQKTCLVTSTVNIFVKDENNDLVRHKYFEMEV